ncbi:hypothetical protein GCM10027160_48330 [Streptomyces calidiresistens]|uniref:DUF4352 domain-containing protein n=1 Tax=Streptomyces calidiresistens TaxID=1485586 RepID=A0A7W3T2L3_9ACTN|nr:hypothetical protein [Streptomyces calidiresistens]MBB0229648.1 hypothetical protein [Streptomyces calidiresistens]
MRHTRTTVALFTAFAVMGALTACGADGGDGAGGGGDATPAEAGGTEEALRAAVRANVDAINGGRADAVHDLLSERCRARTTVEEVGFGLELIRELYGNLTLEEVTVRDMDGNTAVVEGKTGIEALDRAEEEGGGGRWVHEKGEWRNDECDDTDTAGTDGDTVGEGDAGRADTDLPLGEPHTWADKVALTITDVSGIPADRIGEYDHVPEGQAPFTVTLTITNGSGDPVDLEDFHLSVRGITTGGSADSVYLDGSEFLEGRLAAGQTREHEEHFSFDTDKYGHDIVIEGNRLSDLVNPDSPTWIAALDR